jgi:hypothetical protein
MAGRMNPAGPTMSFMWGWAAGYRAGRAASGIETAKPPRRETGSARKGESLTAESRDAQPPSGSSHEQD